MESIISLIKDYFSNLTEVVSESEIRALKITDEYAYRQYDEYLLTKNIRNSFVFALLQLIMGIVMLAFSVTAADSTEHSGFLKLMGSVILIGGAVLYIFYYLHELNYQKFDFLRYRIVFYAFWNIYSVGGFLVSMGYMNGENAILFFVLFAAFAFSVPILRLYENLVLSAIYLISVIYYGASLGKSADFYIAAAAALIGLFCLNSYKCSYFSVRWLGKRRYKELSDRCKGISQTDSLTGMLNRTGLSAKFRERYQNSRGEHKIAVIMADIDNFRYYNHKFGYDRSDGCLYNICNCIRIIAKPVTKLVSRFGGDDFIIILEDMDEIEVVKFAEQIRSSVETMAIPFGDGGFVTISVGVSCISELGDEETYSRLINEADTQLIIAKRSGKNCVGYRNRAFKTEKKKEDK